VQAEQVQPQERGAPTGVLLPQQQRLGAEGFVGRAGAAAVAGGQGAVALAPQGLAEVADGARAHAQAAGDGRRGVAAAQ
jgi:hypothetical protein